MRAVLDTLGAERAVLAGHSISGAVITRFAEAYPEPADTTAASFVAWRRRFPDWGPVYEVDSRMWDRDSADVARRQKLVMPLVTEVRSHAHEVWHLRAPALATCAVGSVERRYGWLTPDSARWRAARAYAEQDQRG